MSGALNGITPTQDQVMGQLRIIIPSLGTLVTAFGVTTAQADSWEKIALASVGPISYIVVAIWSLIANSRKSIMASAAKPVNGTTPAPQIILPVEEAALAQTLPANVVTTNDVKVVAK